MFVEASLKGNTCVRLYKSTKRDILSVREYLTMFAFRMIAGFFAIDVKFAWMTVEWLILLRCLVNILLLFFLYMEEFLSLPRTFGLFGKFHAVVLLNVNFFTTTPPIKQKKNSVECWCISYSFNVYSVTHLSAEPLWYVMIPNDLLFAIGLLCARFIPLSSSYHCSVPQWECACYLSMWISVSACSKACSHWSPKRESDIRTNNR